jgi:co-chaperonin GroES (HSP10)
MKLTDPNEYENYEPIGDKVLLVMPKIEPTALENVGGILVDHAAHLKSSPMRETVVVARGPECKQVEEGDAVLWNINNASPFPFGENNLYFLPESHIVCITRKRELA